MRRSRISGAAAACVVAIGLGMAGVGVPVNRTVDAAANEALDCPVDHNGLRSALITADTARHDRSQQSLLGGCRQSRRTGLRRGVFG
jgi:hypothetical protein